MTTVATIAAAAVGAVDAAITDAVHNVTLGWVTNGAYNYTTGAYAETAGTDTGRAVIDTTRPATDIFPDYTRGPGDELILLEGLTTAPQEGYTLTIASDVWHIRQVQDIVGAGSLFYVIARKVLA